MENIEEKALGSDKFLLKLMSEIVYKLKTDYNYSDEELFALCKEESLLIPVSIFASKLTPTEALTKYLKENCDLSYHEISELINRNERGVWLNYKRAKTKLSTKFEVKDSFNVPVSIFNNNKFTIFEALIVYLKDIKKLKNSKIAKLLKKHNTNIWTVYNKTKVKGR
jgi:hypothetical protein